MNVFDEKLMSLSTAALHASKQMARFYFLSMCSSFLDFVYVTLFGHFDGFLLAGIIATLGFFVCGGMWSNQYKRLYAEMTKRLWDNLQRNGNAYLR